MVKISGFETHGTEKFNFDSAISTWRSSRDFSRCEISNFFDGGWGRRNVCENDIISGFIINRLKKLIFTLFVGISTAIIRLPTLSFLRIRILLDMGWRLLLDVEMI